MLQQTRVQAGQRVGIVEEDVEGEFRLIDDPVVREALEEVGEQGIATFGQRAQKAWPFLAEKPVGKLLWLGRVVQDQKSALRVLDAITLPPLLAEYGRIALRIKAHGQQLAAKCGRTFRNASRELRNGPNP